MFNSKKQLNPEYVAIAKANLRRQGRVLSAENIATEYYYIEAQEKTTLRTNDNASTAGRGGFFGKRGH